MGPQLRYYASIAYFDPMCTLQLIVPAQMHGTLGGVEGSDPVQRATTGVQSERLWSVEDVHHRRKLKGRSRKLSRSV